MEFAVSELVLAPRMSWPWITGFVVLSAGSMVVGLWKRVPGTGWRGIALLVLLIVLANPQLTVENREPQNDIAFLVVDESRSQAIGSRSEQTLQVERQMLGGPESITTQPGFEFRIVRAAGNGGTEKGTRLLSALDEAARQVSPEQIAGAVLLTDGRIHDPGALKTFPAPVHVLVSGREDEFDRNIELVQAPSFGVVRTGASVEFVVNEFGPASQVVGGEVDVKIYLDGQLHATSKALVGVTKSARLRLEHAGPTVVELVAASAGGEETEWNNRTAFTINGIRDRLRVLLISGSPHPAARIWRNLLKADPSVDLVHFTILRPPTKTDAVPVREISLIEFPVHRLFLEEIDGFDLIVLDRFRSRDLLPDPYVKNIARYVREGGALLVAGGAELAGAASLSGNSLREVMPVEPTGASISTAFSPALTEEGRRHPLTAAVEDRLENAGPWYWQAEVRVRDGNTLLVGAGARPLLTVARVGLGRVGVLTSDHAWLWSRGHKGGGPHGELFRRFAHWLMKEPELEEEALQISELDGELIVTRQTLRTVPGHVVVSDPAGGTVSPQLAEIAPGLWRGTAKVEAAGLYHARVEDIEAVGIVGAHDPVELRNGTSTLETLSSISDLTGGALRRISDGIPSLRRVSRNGPVEGGNWLGFPRRNAYSVSGLEVTSLLPAWLALGIVVIALCLAWRAEFGKNLRSSFSQRRNRVPASFASSDESGRNGPHANEKGVRQMQIS